MDFGAVTKDELDKVDFTLQQEPRINSAILSGKPTTLKKVYVGCPQWGRTEWVGKIYPPKTKEKDFLQHYTGIYNCIELNATHYKAYGPDFIIKWQEKAAGRDFKFCPKLYKSITHFGNLTGKEFITNEFLQGVSAFGENLGPIFIQLGDNFSPNRKDELFTYLSWLPKEFQFFLELRHPGWFLSDKFKELISFLKDESIGIVITDSAGRRDCTLMHLTIPKTFIRFVGNSLHPTDLTRIDAWSEKIHYWLDKGIEEVYFIVHSGDMAISPEMTNYVAEALNKECGLNIPEIKMLSTPTLF